MIRQAAHWTLMNIRWRSVFRYPQTWFLLGGTALGYLATAVFTGFRPLALIVGGLISLAMITSWLLQFRRDRAAATDNLLDRTTMLEHLDAIAAQCPGVNRQTVWEEAYQWASDSQAAAADIADRDSTLVPDLLETLYTVEALASNVARSAFALEQVQTDTYRTLTQEQLTSSRERLKATHDQLQQLRDQLVLAQLQTDAPTEEPLPNRLQLLIEANKTTLRTSSRDRS